MDAAIERRAAPITPPKVTDLSEMAKHAAVAALHGVVRERLPDALGRRAGRMRGPRSRRSPAPEKFGELCQRFFTNLVEHNLQYFLDRETPRHIGPGRMAQSVGDLAILDRAYPATLRGSHDHHAGVRQGLVRAQRLPPREGHLARGRSRLRARGAARKSEKSCRSGAGRMKTFDFVCGGASARTSDANGGADPAGRPGRRPQRQSQDCGHQPGDAEQRP